MGIFSSMISDFFGVFQAMGSVLSYTWFALFPLAFYFVFKFLWLDHMQAKFAGSIEWVLLEIIPPKDIEKSPKPMESIYSGMHAVLKGFTVAEEYIKGMFTYSFSLEIVSDGGSVHMYIRTPKVFRNLVEANLYAQYPTVEIREVPDYVHDVPKVVPNSDWDLWGVDFELTKPDPYPIRTYRKFEEDITGTMIDPLSAMIEVMGKIGPNHKIWYQLIITPEKETWSNTGQALIDEKFKGKVKPKGVLEGFLTDLGDIFSNLINGILGKELKYTTESKKDDQPLEFKLTPGEKDVLKALEENVGKNVFKTKMRFLYLGHKEGFDKSVISSFIGAIKQFSDQNLNGFKPNDESKTYANYVMTDTRLRYRQRKIFQRYVDRDPTGVRFILSTEELATVFHLPDMSVAAPHIQRVEAKRGGAPANLPIG